MMQASSRAWANASQTLGLKRLMSLPIVAAMAFDPKRDTELVALDTQHLFEASTTRIGLRKGAFLRAYAYRLIEMFAPQLHEADIASQLREAA